MRIISGLYKGHPIKFPKSKLVRPTTDKNKESIFNYLNNHIDFDGCNVCDIYAGSGSLGLEALSRGAEEVHFVEKNYNVIKILTENIARIDKENKCKIFKTDAVKFTSESPPSSYDLILADPPFFKFDVYTVVKNIISKNFLSAEGILVVERSVQTLREDSENFGVDPIKRLGDSVIFRFDQ